MRVVIAFSKVKLFSIYRFSRMVTRVLYNLFKLKIRMLTSINLGMTVPILARLLKYFLIELIYVSMEVKLSNKAQTTFFSSICHIACLFVVYSSRSFIYIIYRSLIPLRYCSTLGVIIKISIV
jgi:hypothetical protein